MEKRFKLMCGGAAELTRDEVVVVLGALDCLAITMRDSALGNGYDLDKVVMGVRDKLGVAFGWGARGV